MMKGGFAGRDLGSGISLLYVWSSMDIEVAGRLFEQIKNPNQFMDC